MTRLDDWHARLAAYVYEAGRTPFAYGAHDCALFAAGAVEAMTGTDLAAGWRGIYRTLAGGLKAVKRAGHADHVALAAHHFAEITVAEAMPGDLAVVAGPEGPALGVVQGAQVYVATPTGLGLVPLLQAARVFRV